MQSPLFSMAVLSSRMQEVYRQPEPETVQLLMLDPMCPRQRYQFAAPAPLVETVVRSQTPLVVMEPHGRRRNWSQPPAQLWSPEQWRRQQPASHASHAVEGIVVDIGPRGVDGDAILTLSAGRWCEVVSIDGEGRTGTVRWRALDARAPEEQPTASLLEQVEALGKQVERWTQIVRAAGSEASVRQLEERLCSLGRMPPAERPSDRALWVAALINPCGGAGGTLAVEVRPAALCAPAAEARVRVVQAALEDSIERLCNWYG